MLPIDRLTSRLARLASRVVRPASRVAHLASGVLPGQPRLAVWALLAGGTLALGAVNQFARHHALMINASPSLPYWAIWLNRTGTPARGDLIVFIPPSSPLLTRHFGPKPRPFGKRVVGVAGDRVTEQDRMFFVNGKPVALAKTASRAGEPLVLGPTGTIPTGCYFVAAQHKDSFDSRYAAIGWICARQVLGTGSPVL